MKMRMTSKLLVILSIRLASMSSKVSQKESYSRNWTALKHLAKTISSTCRKNYRPISASSNCLLSRSIWYMWMISHDRFTRMSIRVNPFLRWQERIIWGQLRQHRPLKENQKRNPLRKNLHEWTRMTSAQIVPSKQTTRWSQMCSVLASVATQRSSARHTCSLTSRIRLKSQSDRSQ